MKRIATLPDQLAFALKARRLQLGLTQTELARTAGIRQKTVSEFETRPGERSMKTLFRLLHALELELEIGPRPTPDLDADPDAW